MTRSPEEMDEMFQADLARVERQWKRNEWTKLGINIFSPWAMLLALSIAVGLWLLEPSQEEQIRELEAKKREKISWCLDQGGTAHVSGYGYLTSCEIGNGTKGPGARLREPQ